MTSTKQGAYVRKAYSRADDRTEFAENGAPRLLLIGDSYSQDFYNMIRETGAFPGYQIVARYVQARCQLYLGPEDITPYLKPQDREFCGHEEPTSNLLRVARQADVVIFAASWREWSAERLPTTLRNFGFRRDQTVRVIGRKDFARLNRPLVAGVPPEKLAALRIAPPSHDQATVSEMRASLPDQVLVDPYALLCKDWSCPVFTPSGRLISADGAHLTREGAEYVGEKVFAGPELARFASAAGDSRADAAAKAALR